MSENLCKIKQICTESCIEYTPIKMPIWTRYVVDEDRVVLLSEAEEDSGNEQVGPEPNRNTWNTACAIRGKLSGA